MTLLKPLLYGLIAGAAALLVVVLSALSRRRKKRKEFQEMSQIQRRNEALNNALRHPNRKEEQSGPETPMEISWDDKAVKKKTAVQSLMIELVELSDYSRRKYIFRAGQSITIGCTENNQVVLPREGVADRHCEICMVKGRPCVKSASGVTTILKRGKTEVLVSVKGVYINNGDLLHLGSAEVQFRTFKG